MIARRMASMLLAVLALTHFSAAEVAFKPLQNYAAGTNPVAVAVGDFNGDGKRDLAVLNSGNASVGDDGGVSILLGKGDGTFQPAKNNAIGKNCTGIVAGDFDGDGKDDVALVRPGDPNANDGGDVTIFFGAGDGTFRQGPVMVLDVNPSTSNRSIVAADLNGDQKLDLVVATNVSVRVLLGNGNGTFQSSAVYPPLSPPPASVRLLDLNGNGEKDIALVGGLAVNLLLSNGDGTFRQQPELANSILTATGDFNGDKKDDLVVGTLSGIKVCIFNCPPIGGGQISFHLLLGAGDASFQVGGEAPDASGSGDFDGDGKLDLVWNTGTQIRIFPGNADGTFQPPIIFPKNSTGTRFQVLDVNGDGAPDLVLSDTNSIALLVNVGTDFSMSASALDPGTVSPGQSATSSLALKLLSNFDHPVSLTCAVQPARPGGPACSLSSNSVTFDANGEASASLAVTGDSRAVALNSLHGFTTSTLLWFPVAAFALLGPGLRVSRPRQRRFLMLPMGAVLFVGIVLVGIVLQTACGGGTVTNSDSKSTAYTVTVTAASGATQHSTTLSLNVQ